MTKNKIEKTLKAAIEKSGLSRYKISQDTEITQACLSRFVNGERSISLDHADRLAQYFRLELVAKK